MSLAKFRFANYLLPVLRLGLFSVLLSITNIFITLFSVTMHYNHSKLGFDALVRGPTHHLPNPDNGAVLKSSSR